MMWPFLPPRDWVNAAGLLLILSATACAAPPTPQVAALPPVKWYNAAKGFGFIVLDGGGNDVFVHVSALQRAGIMGLSEGQRVYVGVAEGQNGPEAASIQVAN